MKYTVLLKQSNAYLARHPEYIHEPVSWDIFTTGARWMHLQMNRLATTETTFNSTVKYGRYGFLKYSISIVVWLASALFLSRVSLFLIPLSVLFFYFAEVHFLFLFPLLIGGVPNPVWTSIKQTYRIGIIRVLVTVMPIAWFMMAGLFNKQQPFHNWHAGSLAVLVWYQHEVRNRL